MSNTTSRNVNTAGKNVRTHYVRTEDGYRVLVPGEPTRTDQVVSWLGWHLPELAGVLVPAGLAVAVTPWFGLLSAAVAAGWTVHEVRIAKEQTAVKTGPRLPASSTPHAPEEPDGAETGEVGG